MATVTSACNAPGTDTRTAVTTAGEHEFSLHYVEDTAASPDESKSFPSKTFSTSTGRTADQQDIAAKASISLLAQAIETLPITAVSFVSMPSPTTINRRAQIRPQAQTVPSRLCRCWHRR